MIAPPWFVIPPVRYGGIERVVYDLVEALVASGERVTLFAPSGSHTSGALVPTTSLAHGLDLSEAEKARVLAVAARTAFTCSAERGATVVHDHTEGERPRDLAIPVVRTLHGPVTDLTLRRAVQMSRDGDWFVAISRRQRQLFERAARDRFGPGTHIRFAGVVPNPIDACGTPFFPRREKQDYAAFIGRCHWEKGPAEAIQVAIRAGVPLKMALRITAAEQPYFDYVVAPLLRKAGPLVEFLGEIGGAERTELFGRATALIFSSVWDEPFGLALTEALAHGTPVIALRRGSAPEVIDDGVTGILCDDIDEMALRLREAMRLDPAACRQAALQRFDRSVIAGHYRAIYHRAIQTLAGPIPDVLPPDAPDLHPGP
jgi:glycosyltransferase involved in cell wall biosynthesis